MSEDKRKEIAERRKKYNQEQHPALEYGKIPPQNIDEEEALLGGIMNQSYIIIKVRQILKPEMFYKDHHQKIFKAICELNDKKEPIDQITVTTQLRKNGELEIVGGAYVLSFLCNKGMAVHHENYCRAIEESYIGRKIISVSSEAIKDAFDDTCDKLEVRDKLAIDISKIGVSGIQTSDTPESVEMMFDDRMAKILSGELKPIKTGIKGYDDHNGGLYPSDLTIIGAATSNGKTLEAINMMTHIAKTHKCKFYSFEQPTIQIYMRQISILSGNNSRDLMKGIIRYPDKLQAAKDELRTHKTKYCEKYNHINHLKNDITRDVLENGLEVVFCDYIQLMESDKKELRESMGHIANQLKILAKELNISIVLLSQLNRGSDDKKPGMSALKESSSLEQAADNVIILWMPYNEPTEKELIKWGNEELKTFEDIDGVRYKALIQFQSKGRSVGITKYLTWVDENLKIHDELPIQYCNSFPAQPSPITPNTGFDNSNDESPF